MGGEAIRIYDTSPRDGLRNSGIAIDLDDKVRFVQQLERLGVSDIEVGFGGPAQIDTMERLAESVTKPVLYGLSRVNRRELDRVLDALSGASRPGANIFSPASAEFLSYGNKTPARALEASSKAVSHAKSRVANVVFSAQDATRADRAYLIELLAAAIKAGATTISLSDGASHALPREFGALCADLRDTVPGLRDVTLSVHCHNNLGLAVANCAAAIENGARQVECTLNGMGEGGNNTAMQAFVRLLQNRADAFPKLHCAVDAAAFPATERLLADIAQPTDDADSDVIDLLRRWGGKAG